MNEPRRELPKRLDTPAELLRARYRAGEREFRGLNLRGADLAEAKLVGARFEDVDLTEANLFAAKLRRARFTGGSLLCAELHEADLREAEFIGVDLCGIKADDAQLDGASFRAVELDEASLDDAALGGARFEATRAIGASLHSSSLERAVFVDCDLSNADLANATLLGARLVRTKLDGAKLDSAQLGARVVDVDLSKVDLRECDLAGAWLERVEIDGDRFSEYGGDVTLVDVGGDNLDSLAEFSGTIDAPTYERILESQHGWSYHSGDSEPYGPFRVGATPLYPEEFRLDIRIRHGFCPPRELGRRAVDAVREAPDELVARLEALELSTNQLSTLARACGLVDSDLPSPPERPAHAPPCRSDVAFDPGVFDDLDGVYGVWKAEELFYEGIVPPDPEQLSDELRFYFGHLLEVPLSPTELIWQLRYNPAVERIVGMLRTLEIPAEQLERLARACETILAARRAARAEEAEADA